MSNWEKQWREKLKAYEEPHTDADEALWGAISSQLNKSQLQPRKRLAPIWWVGASGVAAALLLIFLLGRERSTHTPDVVYGTEGMVAKVQSEVAPPDSPTPTVAIDLTDSRQYTKENRIIRTADSPNTAPRITEKHPSEVEQSLLASTDTPAVDLPTDETPEETKEEAVSQEEYRPLPIGNSFTPRHNLEYKPVRKSTSQRLSARLSYTGSAMASHQHSGVGNYFYSLDASPIQCSAGERLFGLSEEEAEPNLVRDATINTLNQATETEVVTHQSVPLRVGLSLAYEVWNGLYIESGLVYTRQTTHVRKGSERFFTELSYEEQLLGIPLALKYQFLKFNKWSLYAKTEVLTERVIASSSHRSFGMDKDTTTEPLRGELTKSPSWLWSARLALGLEYHITPRLGLYAEPGIGYRFNQIEHQGVEQERTSLLLDGQVGISFNF